MKRLLTWFSALFNVFMTKVEDPSMMIDQSLVEAREKLNKNREAAVQALAQKHRLEDMLHQSQVQETALTTQATRALQAGREDVAKVVALQLQQQKAQTVNLQQQYDSANATCEQVKKAIAGYEVQVRNMMSEAAGLKARAKTAEVQNSIEKAMNDINLDLNNSAYSQAKEKIMQEEAQAKGRQEMRASSFQSKVDEVTDFTNEAAADDALAELRKQLGMAAPGATVPGPTIGAEESVDQQLQRLTQGTGA